MKLFVALNLPSKVRKRLHKAAAPLRETDWAMRWVEPESIHLTLKYLGEVRPDSADAVQAAAHRVASKTEPFRISMSQLGAFPSVRRPRVIWVGAEATPELRCLKHDLEWELAPLGFERETRAYHPHLTLGRVKEDVRAGEFRDFEEHVRDFKYTAKLDVRTIEVMRSQRSPKGTRYERLSSLKLGEPIPEPDEVTTSS